MNFTLIYKNEIFYNFKDFYKLIFQKILLQLIINRIILSYLLNYLFDFKQFLVKIFLEFLSNFF